FDVIENLSVENDPAAAVVSERIPALGGQIDDRKTAVAEERVESIGELHSARLYVECSVVRVIRATVCDEIRQPDESVVLVDRKTAAQVHSSEQPAHVRRPLADRNALTSQASLTPFDGRTAHHTKWRSSRDSAANRRAITAYRPLDACGNI